jgi:hypothetical protein
MSNSDTDDRCETSDDEPDGLEVAAALYGGKRPEADDEDRADEGTGS